MPELNPLTNEQIFLKKIAENTGSDYNTGDVSEINPLTIDQILLKEIAANTAGQSGDITELEEKVAANTGAIEATQDMISDAYDSTHTYNVGDYCIYENVLYKCNTAIATPEAFTPAKWDATTVADELTELTKRANGKKVRVTPLIGNTSSFPERQFYITDEKTYIEFHFCISVENETATTTDINLFDLPTFAQGKETQYSVGLDIATGSADIAHCIVNGYDKLIWTKGLRGDINSFLVGSIRIILL